MLKFHLLLPEHLLSFEEIIDCFKIYSSFFHSVTFKNRRNSKLILLTNKSSNTDDYKSYLKELEIEEPFMVSSFDSYIPPSNTSAFCLLFCEKDNREFSLNCLEKNISIIALNSSERKEYLDTSCSILVPNKHYLDNINQVTQIVKNLYFDPEVRKLLIKGCQKKAEVIREMNLDTHQ